MNVLRNLLASVCAALGMLALMPAAAAQEAQEAPDALVKRISQEVLETARKDPDIQGGNQQKILALVEEKILPYIDFERMTQLAAGRYWRQATPEQREKLSHEFRELLIYTYSGAISQIQDQTLEFRPLRMNPGDTDVEVRSHVVQPRGGNPIQLNYRMAKTPTGWKIYDVNIMGAWLVATYKGSFASEIRKSGIDGLIKTLAERNERLAGNAGKAAEAS